MIGAGIFLIAAFGLSSKNGDMRDILLVVQLGISLCLNVIISTNIGVLLLHYRRLIVRVLGSSSGQPYLNVMTILIESAALIVIVDIFALATILTGPVGLVAVQMWVQAQPLASLWIIYRVSRGVDYFSNKDEVIESMKFSNSAPILDIRPGI
ncbi:hypothetical protein NP233_g7577 [Leucocoprinus birnbaumii]|uniref:Uncharacterized protein n=1 Tax=Leucocoprinus birnbaumii TaxID=56174 RepID=A0AAD5VP20_9AGAR|nr:hypothetical protein NP233_g7577 [Leucocoprinus birnbaumii]